MIYVTLLRAEDSCLDGFIQKLIELRHRLHQLYPILLVCEALVNLEEGDHRDVEYGVLGNGVFGSKNYSLQALPHRMETVLKELLK